MRPFQSIGTLHYHFSQCVLYVCFPNQSQKKKKWKKLVKIQIKKCVISMKKTVIFFVTFKTRIHSQNKTMTHFDWNVYTLTESVVSTFRLKCVLLNTTERNQTLLISRLGMVAEGAMLTLIWRILCFVFVFNPMKKQTYYCFASTVLATHLLQFFSLLYVLRNFA